MENQIELIEKISQEAKEWRHELHRNPQVMYEEIFASNLVCEKLTEWGIPHQRGFAKTGVAASIAGRRNDSGRAIAFRADMDALPIEEASGQPWASKVPGRMHACGHDGHTATLLALAKYLNSTRNFDGVVQLIFQPAEEGGRGAFRMLEEGLLKSFPFNEIYGYHNWPGFPRGTISVKSGLMLAAVDEFEILLKGRGGHAAFPHETVDVLPAAAQLCLALQTIVSRETKPTASIVISVTNLNAGTGARNVISGSARLTGTVRTFDQKLRDDVQRRMDEMAKGIAALYKAAAECHYERIIDPVINHEESTLHSRRAAATVVGEKNVREFEPLMGGEDFGGFLQARPGSFVAIGQGEQNPSSPHNSGLHSPHYDFNDAIIPIAVQYFAELAERRLPID